MRASCLVLSVALLGCHMVASITNPAFGHEPASDGAHTAPQPSGNELIPQLAGFRFEPWYQLDELRLWQHVGWKVRLRYLPDDVDAFVELMQSERYRNHALDIDWQVVVSLGINRLAELPGIESIDLSGGIPIQDTQLATIARLPRLKHLNLAGNSDRDSVHALMAAQPGGLNQLSLAQTGAGPAAVRALGGFWKPRRNDAEAVRGLVHLTELDLRSIVSPDETRDAAGVWVRWLSKLTQLRRLAISPHEIRAFDDLRHLSELRVLDLHDPTSPPRELQDTFFATISRLSKLRVLRLSLPPTPEQLSQLQPLTRLERIDVLAEGHPTEEFRAQLTETLPNVRTTVNLTSLDEHVDFHFQETPLNDALQFITAQYGIPISLDAAALENTGIAVDESLDGDFRGMSLEEALEELLDAFALIAIPHSRGVTVTSRETTAIWEREYDLSPLLEDIEDAGHHTAHLALALKHVTSSELWGQKGLLLSTAATHLGASAETGIRHRGTQLVVTAGARGHDQVEAIVEQLVIPESLLGSVKWRHSFDRNAFYWRVADGTLKSNPLRVNFADTPLIDCLEYISRQCRVPIILDVNSLEDAGTKQDTPSNLVAGPFTLGEFLDTLLPPLKLAWLVEDGVVKVTTQKVVAEHSVIRVHQFDDARLMGALEPGSSFHYRELEFNAMLKSLVSVRGTEMPDLPNAKWLNRTIVVAPWQSQMKLTKFADRVLVNEPPSRESVD